MRLRGWAALVGLLALLLAPCVVRAADDGDEDVSRISGITFFGNRHTDEGFLRRELGLKVGDPFDMDAVDVATEHLEELDLFSFVEIQDKADGAGGTLLVVQVEERARARIAFGLDYGRRFTLRPAATFRLVNVRGVGDELWFGGRWGKATTWHGGWISPWIVGGERIETEIGASWERYRFMFLPFSLTDQQVSLAVRHGKARKLATSVTYAYRQLTTDPGGDTTDPAVELALEHDGRLRAIYPDGGIHARLSARFAGLGQDSTYQVYTGHLAAFGHLPRLPSVGARVTLRKSGGTVPPWEAVYMGGPEDVRGIDFSTLRGDESFVATVEVRRPIIDVPSDEGGSLGLGVHAFHDWGKAWTRTAGWDSADMQSTFGAGAHLNLLKKSLRFEWARHVNENVYVFEDEFTF